MPATRPSDQGISMKIISAAMPSDAMVHIAKVTIAMNPGSGVRSPGCPARHARKVIASFTVTSHVPATTRVTAGELRLSWRLPETRRNYHLSCSYERTNATLTAVLPPGVNGCNAVFDRRVTYGVDGLAVKRMVCN